MPSLFQQPHFNARLLQLTHNCYVLPHNSFSFVCNPIPRQDLTSLMQVFTVMYSCYGKLQSYTNPALISLILLALKMKEIRFVERILNHLRPYEVLLLFL